MRGEAGVLDTCLPGSLDGGVPDYLNFVLRRVDLASSERRAAAADIPQALKIM
jgi:hypothetical protein